MGGTIQDISCILETSKSMYIVLVLSNLLVP